MQSGSTQTDVLIIGVGLAGTSLALSLPSSMNVTLDIGRLKTVPRQAH